LKLTLFVKHDTKLRLNTKMRLDSKHQNTSTKNGSGMISATWLKRHAVAPLAVAPLAVAPLAVR
jgi:hypothetical protein